MRKDRAVLASLAIILVLGAALRITYLDWEPATFDEVALILSAREYMNGNWLHNFVAFDTPPLTKYFLVASFSIAGYSEIALRIFSALFGTGAIAVAFFFARRLYGDKAALVAAALTAFSIIHIAFSRYAEHLVPAGFFYILAMWLLHDYCEGNNRNFVILGAVVALGLLAKFVMLYFIITAAVYLIVKKKISFKADPVSISVDNYIIKAAAVFVAVLLILWPMFLYPVSVNMSVLIDGSRQRNVSISVPQGLLAFGEVSKSAATEQKTDDVTGYPLGYIWLFMMKESLLFVALFFAGLYFMLKERKKQDMLLMISTLVFLIMLWLQNWGHTYRYFAVFAPAMAIIASRWTEKAGKYAWHALIAAAVISAAFAFYAYPSYVLYYNGLGGATNMETHFSEGLRETLREVNNCTVIYTDRANEYMIGLYQKSTSVQAPADCAVVGMASYSDPTFNLSYTKNCREVKTVRSDKFNRELFRIYRC